MLVKGFSPRAFKRERRRAGMRREDVAVELGVSARTVDNWELGRNEPHRIAIRAMMQLFGVEEDDLMEEWEETG